jgi:hypothetical protein
MKKLMLIVAAVCLLTAGVALAQVEETEENVIYSKVTHIPFDQPLNITATIVGPAHSYLPVKKGVDFELLIPVRDNFLPEMMKTVSSL